MMTEDQRDCLFMAAMVAALGIIIAVVAALV